MGKIIAVANQKGGVGKTTTAVNLTAALKKSGMRVLLCDSDPQGNATSAMGIDKSAVALGTYNVLVDGTAPKAAITQTKYGDVMPSNKDLSGAVVELVGKDNREFQLRDALRSVSGDYDFIIIDCPPSLELLTLNGLCAADSVLIPVQCEYFALEGLADLMNTVRLIKKRLNPGITIEGVLLTMYDGRTNLCLQVAGEVKRYFKDAVYKTLVPRNIRLSEAPSHGKPVTEYAFSSKGAQAYMQLADEVVRRNRVDKA